MKHSDNITFEKYARKSSYKTSKQKQESENKEKGSTSAVHKQHWRQERKNVRENKRYGEFV